MIVREEDVDYEVYVGGLGDELCVEDEMLDKSFSDFLVFWLFLLKGFLVCLLFVIDLVNIGKGFYFCYRRGWWNFFCGWKI